MVTSDVVVVHAGEQPPVDGWQASLFLAGPNPRDADVASWRPAAIEILREQWNVPGTLAVFAPEGRGWKPMKYDRHEWESRWLSTVDLVAFWVPRDMATMPALNTNIEFGRWEDSGRIVLGSPPEAAHMSYLRECASRNGAPVTDSLTETMRAALGVIGAGAYRENGEREVPLRLWRAPEFSEWLQQQRNAGHHLTGGRLLWAHGPGPDYWAFQAVVDGRGVMVMGDSGNGQGYAKLAQL